MKPIETGLEEFSEYAGSDSMGYAELLNKRVEDVNCYFFNKPLSPLAAAKIDGVEIKIEKIEQKIAEELARVQELYVEGAGGLLVPIKDGFTYLDFIIKYRNSAEVIIVGKNILGGIKSYSFNI